MHMDPIMPGLTAAMLALVAIGLVLRRFRQPLVVAYIVAGVLLGPGALGLVPEETIGRLGAIGVLLLLFFVGMEITPQALASRWRVAVVGTGLQIAISVACLAVVAMLFDWPPARTVLLGFVISLSSTAVVLKLLQQRGEDPAVAADVTAVLLAQDIAVAPMLIVLGLFKGGPPHFDELGLQLVGGAGLVLLVAWTSTRKSPSLPFGSLMRADPELQVFVALLFCFGFAVCASLMQLSAALGAFAAGMIVGAARETRRFHEQLKSFEVVFVAAFFVSVGMLIDLDFLRLHWAAVAGLVLLVLLTNTAINAVILKLLGTSWRRSLYAASLLAQIGEFSFVLALVGRQAEIIGEFAYQATIAVISLSLLASPAWIATVRRLTVAGAGSRSAPTPHRP